VILVCSAKHKLFDYACFEGFEVLAAARTKMAVVCVWCKFTDVSEVPATAIIMSLMKQALQTSETSLNFHKSARRYDQKTAIFMTVLVWQ
jgi:hypothetical protein